MTIPLYKQIQQDIFRKIATGALREGDWVASESELATQWLVSPITARNALNGLVDQGLVRRVRGKGTFVIHSPFSTPPSGRTNAAIAAVLPTMATRVEQSYLVLLEQHCREANLTLTIHCSHESPQLEATIIDAAIADGAQGIILFPIVSELDSPIFDALARRRFPLVFIDRHPTDVAASWVSSDNEGGAAAAAQYLFNVAGPDVAMAHFPLYNSAVIARDHGFRQAFADRGYAFRACNDCLIDDSDLVDRTNRERVERIAPVISAHLDRFPGVNGFLATNAEIAQIAFYVCRTHEQPLHLIGFDNAYLPGVPYMAQDFEQVITRAVDILISQIGGDDTLRHETIPVRFVANQPASDPSWISGVVMGAGL